MAGCYVRDEGRPLETALQEEVSNKCMRLLLRVMVVSDTQKSAVKLAGNYVKGESK